AIAAAKAAPLVLAETSVVDGAVGEASPLDVERIALSAALIIFDADHRNATVAAWIANQRLASAPVHAAELEIVRLARKRVVAFKADPLRRRAGEGVKIAPVSLDFDFRYAIDVHFDGALTVFAAR